MSRFINKLMGKSNNAPEPPSISTVDGGYDSDDPEATPKMSPAEYSKTMGSRQFNLASLPSKPKSMLELHSPSSPIKRSQSEPSGEFITTLTRSGSKMSKAPSTSSLVEDDQNGFDEMPSQSQLLISGELEWEYSIGKWKKRKFLLTREALIYVRENPKSYQKKFVPIVWVKEMSMVDQDMSCMLIHDSCFMLKRINVVSPLYFKSGSMSVTDDWLDEFRQLLSIK